MHTDGRRSHRRPFFVIKARGNKGKRQKWLAIGVSLP